MSKKERRSYDKSFKLMAVELHRSGKAAVTVAKDLGIDVGMLRRWTREFIVHDSRSFPGQGKQGLTPEQKEIQTLKKALHEAEMENRIKKGSEHFLQGRQQIFRFIKKDHQAEFDVEKMCKLFKVSRSGYYAWCTRKPSKLSMDRQMLCKGVEDIYHKSKGRYGSPKIVAELRSMGLHASRPRVAKIMKDKGLRSIIRGKFKVCTTDSNHKLEVSANILNREFTATAPSEKWVSDLTYIRTKKDGFT
ncbi:IS3 family transposase [Chitinophaga sp. 30R24]|uniref:IS3 family transposase n=1 Tax=Chitinophaga sp. 30R24 TaxID=3248838 RepID=UPI003B91C211